MLKSYRPYPSEEVVGASIRRVPLPKKQLSVQIGSQDLDIPPNLEQDPCYSYTDVAKRNASSLTGEFVRFLAAIYAPVVCYSRGVNHYRVC
jgi:hypothetical protein